MKPNNFIIFLILLIIIIFASGCNPATSKPSSSPSSQSSSASGSTALRAWVSGQVAQLQLTIPNGNPPYKCSLKPDSSLPEGFTLSNDCRLAGAPILASGSTSSITPPFSVIITDSSNPPRTVELLLTVTIVQSVPKLIPVSGGECTVNKKCTVQVAQGDGGTPPYHFQSDTFANGAPPMGMIIGQDGYLTGTPSKAGKYTFGVCVVDSVAASKCDQTSVIVKEVNAPGVSLKIDSASCNFVRKVSSTEGLQGFTPAYFTSYFDVDVSGTIFGPVGTEFQIYDLTDTDSPIAPIDKLSVTSPSWHTSYSFEGNPQKFKRTEGDSPTANWQAHWGEVQAIDRVSPEEYHTNENLRIEATASAPTPELDPNKEYSDEEIALYEKQVLANSAKSEVTVKCTRP